jgi:hypothetical protein
LVARAAVGAVGIPVRDGEAIFALRASAVVTNAVVAIAVVLLPAVCVTPIVPVGRVGVPVNTGEARRAYDAAAIPPS